MLLRAGGVPILRLDPEAETPLVTLGILLTRECIPSKLIRKLPAPVFNLLVKTGLYKQLYPTKVCNILDTCQDLTPLRQREGEGRRYFYKPGSKGTFELEVGPTLGTVGRFLYKGYPLTVLVAPGR